jgi:cell division protein FtsI/penicillin-binding protein 2
LAPLAACSSAPKPEEVSKAFLDALSRNDIQAAADRTDDAGSARTLIEQVRGGLKATGLRADDVRNEGGDSDAKATYKLTWDLGNNRSWSYSSSLGLRKDGEGNWKVHWEPSVLHPKLGVAQTVALQVKQADLAPVLDRDGSPLLNPENVISVVLDRAQAGDLPAVANSLAGALARFDNTLTAQSIADAAGKVPAGQGYTVVSLRSSDYESVKPQIYALPGVKFSSQTRLLAPDKTFAAQVLPAIRNQVNDQLAGRAGFRVVTLNATGKEADELYSQAPQPAQAITAGLSRRVQGAAEAAVDAVPQAAVLVAIQPSSGEILAVAQNPSADTQGALALTGRYPPGSTFKIITAAAALSAGKTGLDTPQPCPDKTVVDGRVIPNDEHVGDNGTIPLIQAFAKSCNTTFAQLATALPNDALTNTARQLGIGVDFTLPQVSTITGSVPPASSTVEKAEDGFGQGKVVASPFGMAIATATVVKGTVPVPILLRGTETKVDKAPDPLAPPVLDALRTMMREVVRSGTAKQLANIPDTGGKTGTAQFGDGTHSHGWFVGFRGDLAFAVLLVDAGSSGPAVGVAGTFLRALP